MYGKNPITELLVSLGVLPEPAEALASPVAEPGPASLALPDLLAARPIASQQWQPIVQLCRCGCGGILLE